VNGQKARSVLVEEKSPIAQEYFLSVTWDGRAKRPVVLFSDMGGIDIEEVAEKHPELAVAFMKGMIKVGRWANEYKHAAAAILDKQTYYLDVEDTYRGIKPIDLVPNLSPLNLASVEIGKNFMLSHGYIKNDFDVNEWAAPEFLEQAARELLEDEWKKRTTAKLPQAAGTLESGGRIG